MSSDGDLCADSAEGQGGVATGPGRRQGGSAVRGQAMRPSARCAPGRTPRAASAGVTGPSRLDVLCAETGAAPAGVQEQVRVAAVRPDRPAGATTARRPRHGRAWSRAWRSASAPRRGRARPRARRAGRAPADAGRARCAGRAAAGCTAASARMRPPIRRHRLPRCQDCPTPRRGRIRAAWLRRRSSAVGVRASASRGGSPLMRTSPSTRRAGTPTSARSSVLLPAPLAPATPSDCPARRSNDTPRKTCRPPYCTARSRTDKQRSGHCDASSGRSARAEPGRSRRRHGASADTSTGRGHDQATAPRCQRRPSRPIGYTTSGQRRPAREVSPIQRPRASRYWPAGIVDSAVDAGRPASRWPAAKPRQRHRDGPGQRRREPERQQAVRGESASGTVRRSPCPRAPQRTSQHMSARRDRRDPVAPAASATRPTPLESSAS